MKIKYKIEKLDHEGRGIVREDKIIFVENALPEETVVVKITKEKKNWKEGTVTEYLCKSKDRIVPNCPYYLTCGGCHIMHLNYRHQQIWKKEKVKEILYKFAHLTPKINSLIVSDEWNYRNKATFQIGKEIGYFEKRSNQIIPIDQCMIVNSKINQILKELKKCSLTFYDQVMIRTSEYTGKTLMQLKGKISNLETFISKLQVNVDGIFLNDDCIYGIEQIEEKIGNFTFYISPNSFFQINTKQAKKLYDQILKYANLTGQETVLDLYCGTGTIGIYISPYCKEVVGVEVSESSIQNALNNKRCNHIRNIEFISGDVANIISKLKQKFDLIIVDPPRSGLDDTIIQYLKHKIVNKIIYVSCDPVTLARDLKKLSDEYDILEITPVDMFPQTYHVECVCVLNKR